MVDDLDPDNLPKVYNRQPLEYWKKEADKYLVCVMAGALVRNLPGDDSTSIVKVIAKKKLELIIPGILAMLGTGMTDEDLYDVCHLTGLNPIVFNLPPDPKKKKAKRP